MVRGTVQGVGFRPFVHGLARRLGLGGFVRNAGGMVRIEIEGMEEAIEQFFSELSDSPPPLARIENVAWEIQPLAGEREFRIEPSGMDSAGPIVVSPDIATCGQCLAEMLDPNDRRYRYPFLNCTNCGPRLTIIRAAPYDRQRTTMAGFIMCPRCRAEYDDPANRRFHAQPTACADCGPKLRAVDNQGAVVAAPDLVEWFARTLRAGKIGALKGLGGYHLVCDAQNTAAVLTLRQRKHRDQKPFAVMVRDLQAVRLFCEVNADEAALLEGSRRPIVLLRQSGIPNRNPPISPDIAPGNPCLGVMLPYTPLHHLLFASLPADAALVMTSGNRADEPIAFEDAEAFKRLKEIADGFLIHDRPIRVRCDDSVTRVIDRIESPIRRSRGYAPQPIRLPMESPRPILATGGQLKGTFALGRERQAVLSHHMGDLDQFEAYRAFERDIGLYEELFAVRPACLAHDLHPDYASTHYARRRAAAEGIELIAVQHHHAHMAACMAEHGLDGKVIGVSLDGTGYGMDGAIWGGEFLIGDYAGFERAAHLRYVGLPGGDRAIREPWRVALAHLLDAGEPARLIERQIHADELAVVMRMIERRFNCPWTSSAGRLFDAVAALAGVRGRVSFEGQAAMELEWLATGQEACGAYPFDLPAGSPIVIDTRPTIRAVAADVRAGASIAVIARRFHAGMVEMIAAVCRRLRAATGLARVTLSGGVFMNALLTRETGSRLANDGFEVSRHRLVPPNDGGLSLGQLAITARQISIR